MESYLASHDANEWKYVGLDVPSIPHQKVSVLIEGGTQTIGDGNTCQVMAYAPLIKRNKVKEEIIASMPNATMEERQQAYLQRRALMRNEDGS